MATRKFLTRKTKGFIEKEIMSNKIKRSNTQTHTYIVYLATAMRG